MTKSTLNTRRISRHLAAVTFVWATIGASTASAQDSLARAKDFYASAAYDDALKVLDTLHAQPSAKDSSEIAAYQVFCLVALGKNDQAKLAIETIVKTDPLYHPSEVQVSPRIRNFFETARRPLLPGVLKQSYTKAKSSYEKKDMVEAAKGFDLVIALIDDMAETDDPSAADMRTLAVGFRDLAKTAVAPPPPPAPVTPPPAPVTQPDPKPVPPPVMTEAEATRTPASTTANASGNSAGNATNNKTTGSSPVAPTTAPASAPANTAAVKKDIYGFDDADVKKPVPSTRQTMPEWTPANGVEAKSNYIGVLELVIGEDGSVLMASMKKGTLPRYDAALLRVAGDWKYKPATKDGVPVKYRLLMGVTIGK